MFPALKGLQRRKHRRGLHKSTSLCSHKFMRFCLIIQGAAKTREN